MACGKRATPHEYSPCWMCTYVVVLENPIDISIYGRQHLLINVSSNDGDTAASSRRRRRNDKAIIYITFPSRNLIAARGRFFFSFFLRFSALIIHYIVIIIIIVVVVVVVGYIVVLWCSVSNVPADGSHYHLLPPIWRTTNSPTHCHQHPVVHHHHHRHYSNCSQSMVVHVCVYVEVVKW